MLASVPAAATALAFGPHFGFGFGFPFFFFLFPLFWIAVIVVLAIVFGRRRRWAMRNGAGPWAGGWGGGWVGPGYGAQSSSRSAEATLAERFAQGDIEEAEYRARLEVLRANAAHPPQPPQG